MPPPFPPPGPGAPGHGAGLAPWGMVSGARSARCGLPLRSRGLPTAPTGLWALVRIPRLQDPWQPTAPRLCGFPPAPANWRPLAGRSLLVRAGHHAAGAGPPSSSPGAGARPRLVSHSSAVCHQIFSRSMTFRSCTQSGDESLPAAARMCAGSSPPHLPQAVGSPGGLISSGRSSLDCCSWNLCRPAGGLRRRAHLVRTRRRTVRRGACGATRPTGSSRVGSRLLAVASSGAYSISLYSGPQYPVVVVVAGVRYDDWYGRCVLRSRGGLTTHDCHWPDVHLRCCAKRGAPSGRWPGEQGREFPFPVEGGCGVLCCLPFGLPPSPPGGDRHGRPRGS